jgi:ATP-dependent helicase/nuclease subunit A
MQQMAAMVERRLLTPQQAKLVDPAAIQWLLSTDVGQLLRQRAGRIIRELPFLDSLAPVGIAVADPEDRILLRGRIDALIPMDDGLVVIDYKTDYAAPSPDSTRYSEYARQVQAYRQALERSGHGPVLGAKLIFLRARTILEM